MDVIVTDGMTLGPLNGLAQSSLASSLMQPITNHYQIEGILLNRAGLRG
jgi:hypothetical protein